MEITIKADSWGDLGIKVRYLYNAYLKDKDKWHAEIEQLGVTVHDTDDGWVYEIDDEDKMIVIAETHPDWENLKEAVTDPPAFFNKKDFKI